MALREISLPRHGVEHPDEEFEFARFCLLKRYQGNGAFASDLERLRRVHSELLTTAARSRALGITGLADYRMAWGLLSFSSRRRRDLHRYREELTSLARSWGLAATWCAPSLHLALVAAAYGGSANRSPTLTPFFTWDTERQGEAVAATVTSLLRLLLLPESRVQSADMILLERGDQRVYYDPRVDSWRQCLRDVRQVLGTKRLRSSVRESLMARRRQIEGEFARAGYSPRPKPRMLDGEHKLARWAHWTFLAICPPTKLTSEILPIIGKEYRDTQHVDQAIKYTLDLLGLPSRRHRKGR